MITFLNESPIDLVNLFPIVCPITPRITMANSLVRECAKVHDREWAAYSKLIGKTSVPIGYANTTGMITWSVMHNPGQIPSADDWDRAIATLAKYMNPGVQFVLPILEPKPSELWDCRILTAVTLLAGHNVIFASTNPGILRCRSIPKPRRIITD